MEKQNVQLTAALSFVATSMIGGTLFYHFIERWTYVDAFYFTGVTLTTVGYGDLVPHTSLAKIFTVFLAFIGVSTFVFSLTVIAEKYFEYREKKLFAKKIFPFNGYNIPFKDKKK